MDFAKIIKTHIAKNNLSPIGLALSSGLNRDAIRSVLRGRSPSVGRAAEICAALGLEFYVGPPRVKDDPTAQTSHLSLVHDDVSDNAENEIADPTAEPQKIKCSGFQHVNDKRLADMIARLVDDWSAGGEFRRGQLYERFEDIKANTSPRRVAELIGWVIIDENGYQNGTE